MTYKEAVHFYEHKRHSSGLASDRCWMEVVDAILGRLTHIEESNAVLRERVADAADTILTDCYDTEGVQ